MTNKINGIDVSECKHLKNDNIKKPLCRSGGCTGVYRSCLCEGNPDCYYKQLKRLQEENEELKSRNANLRLNLATYDLPEVKKVLTDWRTGELDKKFKKLQKENEELKTENEQLKKPCLVMPKVKQLAIPIEKYEKLHKALEEIRKIVEPIKENTCFGMNCGAVDWILNEINEVLNDN